MGIDGGHLLHRCSDLRGHFVDMGMDGHGQMSDLHGHFVDIELYIAMSWVLVVVIYSSGVATFVVTLWT